MPKWRRHQTGTRKPSGTAILGAAVRFEYSAFRAQTALFAKHGYRPDGSELCQRAESAGAGVPMIKQIA